MGLGLRVGATLAAVWKACRSFSRSQVIFMGPIYLYKFGGEYVLQWRRRLASSPPSALGGGRG